MSVYYTMKHVLDNLGIFSEKYLPYYTAVADPAEGRLARVVLTPPRYGASSVGLAYAIALETESMSRYCRTLVVSASERVAEYIRRRAAATSLLRKEVPDSPEFEAAPFKVVSAEEFARIPRGGCEFFNIIVDGPECFFDDVVDGLAKAASEGANVLVVGTLSSDVQGGDGVLALRTYGFDVTAFPGLSGPPRGTVGSFDNTRFSAKFLKGRADLDPRLFNIMYQHKPVWRALQPANRVLCRSGAAPE